MSEWLVKRCGSCSVEFRVPPYRETAKYCSQPCFYAARPRQSKVCPTCRKRFSVPPSRARQEHCSRACHDQSRTLETNPNIIGKTCPVCGKKFRVWPSQNLIVCCSQQCAGLRKRKAPAQQLRDMSEPEIAWLAGLFDGEGSVVLIHRKRTSPSYRIQITNTHRPLIDRIFEVTGVGNILTKEHENPRHATTHDWMVGGPDAVEILWRMRPWLLVKAERADAVFAGEVFPRQSRWDDIYPTTA